MPDALAKDCWLTEEGSGVRLCPLGALGQIVLIESLADHCLDDRLPADV